MLLNIQEWKDVQFGQKKLQRQQQRLGLNISDGTDIFR